MNLEEFMRESNAIESEFDKPLKQVNGMFRGALHENDLAAAKRFLANRLTEESLKRLHSDLSIGRGIRRGAWRDCQVQVGGHTPPGPGKLNRLMYTFFNKLRDMSAWEAHNLFEQIHPFEDLNGRTGRLIWLHKMERDIRRPFLQEYYYQTLNHDIKTWPLI